MRALRSWLQRAPQPHTIRVTNANEEQRTLKLSEGGRNKWKAAEQAVLAMGAVSVECIAADGVVLRAQRLVEEEDETSGPTDEQAETRARKLLARERGEMAHVIAELRLGINEAYAKGAEAASIGQENLVDMVQMMTAQWSGAIQSLHSVSMNLANVLIRMGHGGGDEEPIDTNGPMVQQLVTAAVAQMMGTKPAAEPNGTGKKG